MMPDLIQPYYVGFDQLPVEGFTQSAMPHTDFEVFQQQPSA